jgi:formylglycine-generating enzyme required for sulfatase activity
MLGNVWEWCLDRFDVAGAHETLWTGNAGACVLRGGSFNTESANCRCAFRFPNPSNMSSLRNGFRICFGIDVSGSSRHSDVLSVALQRNAGVLAPPETRVAVLTVTPKVGEVFTLPIGSNVTMELMGIPPGEFLLGSTKEERAWALASGQREEEVKREGEAPRKAAITQGFWMGRTEVSVGQWRQFVKETGYLTDGERIGRSHVLQGPGKPGISMTGRNWRDPNFGFVPKDDQAVCCVSWNDAVVFCEWLTGQERRRGRLPAGCVVRLPTEAEWEYACRAGTRTKFWWGDSIEDGATRMNRVLKGGGYVYPVDGCGPLGRNGFGLADMLGNVYEWCLDEFDPMGAHGCYWVGNPDGRVLRGGAVGALLGNCRSAARHGPGPITPDGKYGFRVCVGVDMTGGPIEVSSPSSGSKESGILAPPETRVTALTTTPKVGEVYTLPLGSNVTMELMGIPPGEFMLGSTKEEQAWVIANDTKKEGGGGEGETPRKAVIRKGFWMGRTEMAVGQWTRFVEETGYVTDAERDSLSAVDQGSGQSRSPTKGRDWRKPGFGFKFPDDHPVCNVSWNDAVAFCGWRTEQDRKAGRLPEGFVVRLPTEAEWEYACRAGTQTKFWWGDSKEDGQGRLNWCGKEVGRESVTPVDSFGKMGRNGFGLADMLGNVREWCLDEYDAAQAHEECYRGNSGARVLRGGAFFFSPVVCRSASRHKYNPSQSFRSHGFRVVVGPAR